MKRSGGKIIYSPSDLIRYLASPFASWMDRYNLENPGLMPPDKETEDQVLIARTGDEHEQSILSELEKDHNVVVKIERQNFNDALAGTQAAIGGRAGIVYQAALKSDMFEGYSDFLILDDAGNYELWDTKLARSPKPYYAVQLCCYTEMYAETTGEPAPEKFGIILGNGLRAVFRTEDYFHYYLRVKDGFLRMQEDYTGDLADRPEPQAGADHSRWTSYADQYFEDTDHLVRVAGITNGQIKKLRNVGITTMAKLAVAEGIPVLKLAADIQKKLIDQARLQCQTRADRVNNAEAKARFELIRMPGGNVHEKGFPLLPPPHSHDLFFDMEGYPLAPGGLEYLFGASLNGGEFFDWWAHDRNEEKQAFEGFIDWAYNRWLTEPEMHIYHYASYEESAVRRLSTRHDTRQEEVDNLLRNNVFVDLYKIVRQGLRIGEESYSIKYVERQYRARRITEVATAGDSIVQYARWIESSEGKKWDDSPILNGIRDYNKDDCHSTEELSVWLREIATKNGINPALNKSGKNAAGIKAATPEVAERLLVAEQLKIQEDPVSLVLADLVDFHRREQKPMWWRMFDRTIAEAEEICDDPACIQGLKATGMAVTEKSSQIKNYTFDPLQECKLEEGKSVMFTHNLDAKFTITMLNLAEGRLALKLSTNKLNECFTGSFPAEGDLMANEFVATTEIQAALTSIGRLQLSGKLPLSILAMLNRKPPAVILQRLEENTITAAVRVTSGMTGACLVIQGPPGTGKTYTGAKVINALIAAGKRVGVASNSHKAIINLLCACGDDRRADGGVLMGLKVGGDGEGELFENNTAIQHIKEGKNALAAYKGGVIGGTAWLFSRPEWEGELDFLFIDEAGQVALANAVAMARSASNIILLGDQMQLEQPTQGSHPGDSGMSCLQFALKDELLSMPDVPVYHAVVPLNYGLFLGESRRMHPAVCRFISESIYENRLNSHPDCANQFIADTGNRSLVDKENGIIFIGVRHDGNIQQSEEEAEKAAEVYRDLLGRMYTAADGKTRPLVKEDFLFISPYNSQVRTLKSVLPEGARVGSVDKFQGQEAPVCILSLCSSYGEYGSRGLSFILDRNRVNVAISRAQCLSVIIADPRIALTPANSLNEMALLNLFCKLTNAYSSNMV